MPTPESQFVDLVRTWLASLPHDLKIAFEAMDDENLARTDRELAIGAIIYVVSTNDSTADRNEAVSAFADDAVLLRLALRRIAAKPDEDSQAFRERFPELFDNLDRDLELCSKTLGDLMTWLEAKVDGLHSLAWKGKKVPVYLDNDEAREDLFERGLRFRTDYPIDERTVNDKLKKASTVLDGIRRRRTEEQRAAGAL